MEEPGEIGGGKFGREGTTRLTGRGFGAKEMVMKNFAPISQPKNGSSVGSTEAEASVEYPVEMSLIRTSTMK